MYSAVVVRPGETHVRELEKPEPGPGEVRVRLEGCGVCGSNLPLWEGRDWFEYPLDPGSPGHEGWGSVDAVGPGVRGVRRGERVAVLSYRAFAEYDVASLDGIVRLPGWLDGRAFPGEPLGCAMNVFHRAGICEGQTVAVVGIGFLGLLLVQLAVSSGARVIALSRRPYSLELALANGARDVVRMGAAADVVRQVEELTGGMLCDCVIEAVGLQEPLDVGGAITRERGRLVVAGFHQEGRRTVDMQLWNWRGIDVINAHEREPAAYTRGMRAAVDAIEKGRMDPFPLFTHVLPLESLGDALDLLHHRPDGFVKALVTTEA